MRQVKPSTAARYAQSLKRLEPFLRPRFVDEIDGKLVAEIVRARQKEAENATVRRDLTALSSVLEFCIAEDWREDNPALTWGRRIKERRDPIVLPELDHIEYVARKAPPIFGMLIRAALLTGCRQDELVKLTRPQLDLARKQLTLYQTKANQPRTIELSDEAVAVFQSVPPMLGRKWVFCSSRGGPFDQPARKFYDLVKSAQASAQREGVDFRPMRFHDLRHRYAVDYLKNSGSIYDLQQQLGHSSIVTTEIYLRHLTPEEQRRAKQGSAQKPSQSEEVRADGRREK